MTTVYLEDQQGGIAVVLRDANVAPYYPPAAVGAARVEVWVRSKGKGVDAAVKIGDFRPGSEVDFGVDSVGARDLLVATVSVSSGGTPSISDLNHAEWHELNYEPLTGTAAGFDEHVPTVTEAPTIAKADNSNDWIVFTPAPDDNGATLTGCDIHVEKASDATVFDLWQMLPVGSSHRIDQKAYPCKIKYRWRNQSSEDAGNGPGIVAGDGRGISAWSPQSNAAEIGAGAPDPAPSAILPTFDPDPHDARAGIQTDVLT
jgi:hypothetical protein